MSFIVVSLLILGVAVVVTGIFILGDSHDNSHRVIKPSIKPSIKSSRDRLDSRPLSARSSGPTNPPSNKDIKTSTESLENLSAPSDPFDRVSIDTENPQATAARATAREMADTDPVKIVHIIRKWRQEDKGGSFR